MKRFCFAVLLLVFVAASAAVQASAWDWWAPTLPNTQQPSTPPIWQPTQPAQPTKPTTPTQPTTPTPSPSTPIQPVQPSAPSSGSKVPVPSTSLTSDEQRIIDQVNQERIKNGKQPLQVDYTLVSLAKKKSYDMATNSYFSHVSPTYGTVYSMLDQAGVSYSRAGENIAQTGDLNRVHSLFMNSSGHKANILHSGYTHIGVGIAKRGTSYYVTQIFIKK